MKLLCDICGGQLQMNSTNDGATCVNCGMNYSVESLRNKLSGQQPAAAAVETAAPVAQVEIPEELPIAQVESAEEGIPIAQVEVCEEETVQGESVFFTQEAPAVRTLVLERKFDLQALRFVVSILVDDEEVATLGSKGGAVTVPVTQGSHEIKAVVWDGKKVHALLESVRIEVGEHDWYGLFYVRRTAWNAYWQMDFEENSQPNIMTIEDIFTIAGRGTVITGTVQNGKISVGEAVVINNKAFVVQGLEHYKKMINTATEGMGIGMLLQDVEKNDFKVGDLVYKGVRTDGFFKQ